MSQKANTLGLIPADATVNFMLEIQDRISRATSVAELLETSVSVLRRVPGTIAVWIYQRDERGTLTPVHCWEAANHEFFPISGDTLGTVLHQRWISAHRLGHASLEFAYPFTPEGYPSQAVAPMLLGDELIGAIVVERRDGEVFPYVPVDLGAIAMVAAVTGQTLQTLVLRHRLPESDQARLDQERRRIGRLLHDGIVQDLAYVTLKLDALERTVDAHADGGAEMTRHLREQVDRSIASVRGLITELRRGPNGMSAPGMTGYLRDLAARSPEHQPTLSFDLGPLTKMELAPEIERAVIGIVREALQNIRKHAHASNVRIDVRLDGEVLLVTVADDGVGIAGDGNAVREGHFGMEQMRELAEDMGGELSIDSGPENGTRVHARIPLSLTQRDR